MTTPEMQALLRNIKQNLRVTKVVATRSVKTQRGDFFAGFSAAWNSVQEEGPGADLDVTMSTEDISNSGMTLTESKVAQHLVSMQADMAAYEAAFVNNAISASELADITRALKNNYGKLIQADLVKSEKHNEE